MIQEGRNLEEIVGEVLARYEASPERVAADVRS
jgi:coenzyme PQQ synthesis protein D (PqqD)